MRSCDIQYNDVLHYMFNQVNEGHFRYKMLYHVTNMTYCWVVTLYSNEVLPEEHNKTVFIHRQQ